MSTATVGTRYQIVIPASERRKLDMQPGDKVAVEVVGDHLVVRIVDACRLRGLGRDLESTRDAVDYVRELRAEWGTRK